MNVVSYNVVSKIFDNATVWCSGHEEYWYRYAWDALCELGKTSYDNKKEYYRVLMYALSIVRVYDEFCGYAFEESDNICWLDLIDGVIPEIVIGEAVSDHLPDDYFYDEDEIEDALLCILDDVKYEVFRMLQGKMTESDAFVWMYCTGCTPYKSMGKNFTENPDEDDEYEVNSYDDYKKMIDETYESIVNDDISGNDVAAFDYICAIM